MPASAAAALEEPAAALAPRPGAGCRLCRHPPPALRLAAPAPPLACGGWARGRARTPRLGAALADRRGRSGESRAGARAELTLRSFPGPPVGAPPVTSGPRGGPGGGRPPGARRDRGGGRGAEGGVVARPGPCLPPLVRGRPPTRTPLPLPLPPAPSRVHPPQAGLVGFTCAPGVAQRRDLAVPRL